MSIRQIAHVQAELFLSYFVAKKLDKEAQVLQEFNELL